MPHAHPAQPASPPKHAPSHAGFIMLGSSSRGDGMQLATLPRCSQCNANQVRLYSSKQRKPFLRHVVCAQLMLLHFPVAHHASLIDQTAHSTQTRTLSAGKCDGHSSHTPALAAIVPASVAGCTTGSCISRARSCPDASLAAPDPAAPPPPQRAAAAAAAALLIALPIIMPATLLPGKPVMLLLREWSVQPLPLLMRRSVLPTTVLLTAPPPEQPVLLVLKQLDVLVSTSPAAALPSALALPLPAAGLDALLLLLADASRTLPVRPARRWGSS